MRLLIAASAVLLAGAVHAQTASDCTAPPPAALPPRAAITPLAPELAVAPSALGEPAGVLAHAANAGLDVDSVLWRRRLADCLVVARATPADTSGQAPGDAGYKPQTKFDNTPWRFDMSQNGKRMTAEEFDAWMKARGVRVAKGAPGASVAPPPPPPAEKQQDDRKK